MNKISLIFIFSIISTFALAAVAETAILENQNEKAVFNTETGALILLENKLTFGALTSSTNALIVKLATKNKFSTSYKWTIHKLGSV